MRKLLFLAVLTVLIFCKQTPYALASPNPFESLQFIYVPSLDIFLPIQTAQIQNGEWQLNNDQTAFFGQGSAYPGTKGVSVVFAHAKQGLFALLPKLKSGDDIVIISNQKMFLYTVTKKQIVSPQNTEILQKNNAYKLLLFTCYGKNDKERIAFYATLYMETNLTRDDKDLYDT